MAEGQGIWRYIGSGMPDHTDHEPSSEWFPQRVTPGNFLDYWTGLDARYWPRLAMYWLSAGYGSDDLRWLSRVSERDADEVTTERMVSVLRSLGVAIELPAEFLARCSRAITRIQPDLDATGFGQYRLQARNATSGNGGLPAVYAALPDGSWWSSGSAMTQDMDDAVLLLTAAESVSDTLVEVLHVFWPTCAEHGGPPMTLERNGGDAGPVWSCQRGSHVAAPLGRLTRAHVER